MDHGKPFTPIIPSRNLYIFVISLYLGSYIQIERETDMAMHGI